MKRTHLDASVFLIVFMILLLLGGAAAAYFSVRSDPAAELRESDRIVHTLFVFEDQGRPAASYVLMYYPPTRRAAMVDVPGEVGLIIKSLGRVDRIDALYDSANPAAYREELGSLLGIEIPYSIAVPGTSLSPLVDLMDGVPIFVSDAIEDLSADPPALIPPGSVVLDGPKARTYLLYGGDEDAQDERIAQRQRFATAFIGRIGERSVSLLSKDVFPIFRKLIRHSMDNRTLAALISELSNIEVDRLSVQRVAGNAKEVSGQTLLFPYYDGNLIKDMVKQALASLTRTSESGQAERVYTVEVLNGTTSSGLARSTADLLEGFGYEAVSVANADRADYERSEIVDRTGDPAAAKLFADVIRCESIRSEPSVESDGAPDFTFIIGKDFNGRYVTR